MIEVSVSADDLKKLRELHYYDLKDDIIQTSAAQYIEFKLIEEEQTRNGDVG